jgi:ParB-like chromosome segregation protein Spo0J
MQTILISDILVADRQRQDLGDLNRDFSSIKEIGLIQPIVLDSIECAGTTIYKLKVGGRRLAWLSANGYTELFHGTTCDPARPGYILSGEVTERQRQEAELIENFNRHDLHWKEACVGIARVHRLRWMENKSEGLAWSQKHTGRLLGIDSDAKVTYALQVADELVANPEGDLSKLERFSDAIKWLIERTEKLARAEQERRREILRKIEEKLLPENQEGNIQTIPADIAPELFEPVEEKPVVYLSNMLYHGDFPTIAETDFPPDVYPCAIAFDSRVDWREQTMRLLRANSYLIMFCDWGNANPYQVIWNILGLEPDDKLAFLPNTKHIGIFTKGNPFSPCPSPTSVISANDEGGKWPPTSVLSFLLQATSSPGDSILLPTGGPVDSILELSRRPICFESNAEQHEKNMAMAKAYYENLYCGNVEFK